jgi:hypothetical protein
MKHTREAGACSSSLRPPKQKMGIMLSMFKTATLIAALVLATGIFIRRGAGPCPAIGRAWRRATHHRTKAATGLISGNLIVPRTSGKSCWISLFKAETAAVASSQAQSIWRSCATVGNPA